MSYMDQFKPVKLASSKGGGAKTWDEIVEDAVNVQKKINNGEEQVTAKGNPIKSWYQDGMCRPKIWISYLFGDEGYPMTQEQYDGFLDAMSDWKNDTSLTKAVNELEQKKIRTDELARKSRAEAAEKKKREQQ